MGAQERPPGAGDDLGGTASAADPDDLLAYGRALLASGDRAGAESTARLLLGLDPDSAAAHVLLVFALIGSGRGSEARAAAARAIEISPEEAPGYVALAAAWLADRRALEGEAAARRAVAIDPGSADAHYVLGTALEMRQAKRAAQVEFDLAVELDPRHSGAAERIWSSARSPMVGAVAIVAYLAFLALRILGGRFTDRVVVGLLLFVTAAFVIGVLVGLRQQRRRLARLSTYARLIVGLESNRRWSQGLGRLAPSVLVVTAIIIGLSIVTVLYAVGEKPTLDVKVGDCFSFDRNVSIDRIAVIPCQLPHDIEVFAVLSDPSPAGTPFPGLDPLRAALLPRCNALYPAYVGVPFGRGAPADIRPFVPEESYWVLNIRLVFCGLGNPSGGQLVGSLRAPH